MTTSRDLEALANYHCRCGENPLWDDRRKVLYWTDIPAGRLFRYDAASGAHEQFYDGGQVGGFTLQDDGALLLFGENQVRLLRPDGSEAVMADDVDDGMTRFNDVIADPAGRVYAGTMGKTRESGGLFRMDTDGRFTCLFRGTGVSNGVAFTPGREQFYWTDSTNRRIYRFRYDQQTGELSDRRLWLELSPEQKTPDGMTVDRDGGVWSARWDGFGVFRYTPEGELVEKIELPVAKVSSVIFGGDDLDELYITTAGGDEAAETPDGTLYRLKVGVRGLGEFRSRVAVP